MTIDEFNEALKHYPVLYREAANKLASEASMEFAMRYLCKCVNLLSQNDNPTYEPYLGWGVPVRRALDCYILTQDTDPIQARLKKIPAAVPLLYQRKYGAEWIERIQKECGVTRWSPCCDVVIRFLEEHNLTLDDVHFETHWGGWKGDGARLYSSVVTRGARLRGRQTKYLYVATNDKTTEYTVTAEVTFRVRHTSKEELEEVVLEKIGKLHDTDIIKREATVVTNIKEVDINETAVRVPDETAE